MSELIENHVIPNELSNLINLGKKHFQKRHRTLRRDRKQSEIPVRTLEHLSNKNRNVTQFVYECKA